MIYEFDRLLETVSKGFTTVEKPDTDIILMTLNIAQTRFLFDRYLNKPTTSDTVAWLQKKADDLRTLIQPAEPLNPIAITSGPYGPGTPNYANNSSIGYTVALNSNKAGTVIGTSQPYLFYLRSDSYVSRVTSLGTSGFYNWTPNELANSFADIEKVTTNLYNTPIVRQPVVNLLYSGAQATANPIIRVIVDSYTTLNPTGGFWLEYIRQPRYLGFASVLPTFIFPNDTGNANTPGYWNLGTTTVCELALHTHEEITRFAVDIYLKEYKLLLGAGSGKKQDSSKEE
jgi:hypothetical protein